MIPALWLVVLAQLAWCPWVLDSWNTPKMLVLAAGAAAGLAGSSSRLRWQPSALWPWAAFAVAFAVSCWRSQAWPMSLCGVWLCGWETALLALLCFLAFLVGSTVDRRDLARAGAAAGFLAAAVGLAMSCSPSGRIVGRAMGTYGHPVYWGSSLTLGLTMILGSSQDPSNQATAGGRFALAGLSWRARGMVALVCAAVMASGSRGAAVACAASAAYLLRWRPKMDSRVLAFLSLAGWIAWQAHSRPLSDMMRGAQNAVALRAWLAHPWVGWGPATYLYAFQSLKDARSDADLRAAWEAHMDMPWDAVVSAAESKKRA